MGGPHSLIGPDEKKPKCVRQGTKSNSQGAQAVLFSARSKHAFCYVLPPITAPCTFVTSAQILTSAESIADRCIGDKQNQREERHSLARPREWQRGRRRTVILASQTRAYAWHRMMPEYSSPTMAQPSCMDLKGMGAICTGFARVLPLETVGCKIPCRQEVLAKVRLIVWELSPASSLGMHERPSVYNHLCTQNVPRKLTKGSDTAAPSTCEAHWAIEWLACS